MDTLEPRVRKELLTFLRREYQARSAMLFRDPSLIADEKTLTVLQRQAMYLKMAIGYVFDHSDTGSVVLQTPQWVIEKFRHDLILEEGGEWRLLDPRHVTVPKKEMWETFFGWEARLLRASGCSSFPPRT